MRNLLKFLCCLPFLFGCAMQSYRYSTLKENNPTAKPSERKPAYIPPPQTGYFNWPLTGYVSSGYGRRRGRFHEGIDIPARKGTPVRSARSGYVLYAGNKIRGYGNMVVIRHNDNYSTIYAHLSKIDVRPYQFINRDQLLGKVGRTGHATSPHLHFEIRVGNYPVNPLLYLQAQYATTSNR